MEFNVKSKADEEPPHAALQTSDDGDFPLCAFAAAAAQVYKCIYTTALLKSAKGKRKARVKRFSRFARDAHTGGFHFYIFDVFPSPPPFVVCAVFFL